MRERQKGRHTGREKDKGGDTEEVAYGVCTPGVLSSAEEIDQTMDKWDGY